jgi:hypothetical protein
MVWQIVSGPLAGKYWYWSEEINPERGCRPDCRGRADRGDRRAVQKGHQNRLVGNPGRPPGGVEGYTEGHGTPAGADFRYLLEQLGANPRDGARRSIPPTVRTMVYAEP